MKPAMRERGRRVATLVGAAWIGLWLLAIAASFAGIQIVYTPSVPMGVYWARALPPRLVAGDYVCLEAWRPHAPPVLKQAIEAGIGSREWLHGEDLTKLVAAVPGDRVEYREAGAASAVLVNGVALRNSAMLERDGAGVPLPHASLPRVLGPNEVWLTSTHPRGFDSRYYGPVDVRSLACKSERLWAW
jgi:conjugative transfer signal peptidase TraF